MQVSHHVEELQRQLLNAAATGGTETAETVERLAVALEAAARLAILDALAEATGEITRELAPGSVDLRLRGRDVEFAVSRPAAEPDEEPPGPRSQPATVEDDDDSTASRTTVRLPDALKARAAQAAAAEGVSFNTWLVRTVAAAVDPARPAARESQGSSYSGWLRG
jgi:HicB family